jgi:hypothetical protein
MIGACTGAVNVRVSVVAPSFGTTSLITIPNSTTASIVFAASNLMTDTGAYTVKVEAGYGASFTTVVTSASLTYEYINPCLIIPNAVTAC